MASKTSEPIVVDRGTSGGKSYYVTDVTTLADGSVKRETYRSDAKGIKQSKVQEVTVDKDGKLTDNVLSTASVEEQRDLRNPNSQLRNGIRKQVESTADDLAGSNIDGTDKATIQKASFGSGNAAINDNQVAAASKPAADAAASKGVDLTKGVDADRDGTRTQFPTLSHPEDLGTSKQDVIRFDMMEYQPQKFLQGDQIGFASRSISRSRSIGSVTLPIPSGISDQNSAEWGSNSMNALDIAKADIALSAMQTTIDGDGPIKGFGESAGNYLDFIRTAPGASTKAIQYALGAAAAGVEANSLMSRTTGQVLNPNMELLFKGPSLRPFQFKFTLAPRSKEEALTVVSIIRFFKQGSAPIRSKSNLFLKTPHTFQIRYLHRGEKADGGTGLHFKLNAFKECALQNVGVNYTPTGNYATYQDGTMVSYELTLGFSELEPIFNDDYGMGNGKEADEAIGF
jgi:hypothetical protein